MRFLAVDYGLKRGGIAAPAFAVAANAISKTTTNMCLVTTLTG